MIVELVLYDRDHPFEPKDGELWERCAVCGLAEAAHEHTSTGGYRPPGRYRCPLCVERSTPVCRHKRPEAARR